MVDAWTLMILKEIFLGNTRFDGLLAQTGMAPRSLTLRLSALGKEGVLKRVVYQESPVRYEYLLTAKGIELWPVVVMLKEWGDKWMGPWEDSMPPLQLEHKGRGHRMELNVICNVCGEPVNANKAIPLMAPAMKDERDALAVAHGKTVRASRANSIRKFEPISKE